MLHGPAETQRRARALRRTMTLPEVLLWQVLRTRPAGLRFRRQHPAGRYILDFFCASAGLAVEVDGEAHGRGDRPARDAVRDRWLNRHGVMTIRVRAVDVLADPDAVVRHIVAGAGHDPSLQLGSGNEPNPPPAGEGDRP